MSFSLLFSPGKIGLLETKNKIVMPPMVRNYASKKGEVTPRYEAHIDSIAKGGCGLLILEASYISPEGKGFVNELGIYDDSLISGLKKLSKIAHQYGAKIGPQLYHAGRQTHHNITGTQPVSASTIPCPVMQDPPKKLSIDEIIELENKYCDAAIRAKEADFDFVEIHAAHGYLITQFLSPFSNERKDKYGGNFENRFRFLKNIILKIQAVLGNDFPLIVRLSADEMIEKGLKLQDTIKIAQELEKLSIQALHISAGNYATYNLGYMIPPMASPEAPLVKYAFKIKQSVKIPVITVAKIHRPELAEKILKENKADFIGLGRSLLADPEWPNKTKNNDTQSINPCISCNQSCISRLFAQQNVECTVNPLCGFEDKIQFQKTKKPKKILIAGSGPAGLYCANKLTELGHKVILFEKNKKLGGQLNLAEKPPFREGISLLKNHLINQASNQKIIIKLGTELTPKIIEKEKPDYTILATGSTAIRPPINGIDYPNVILAEDILSKKKRLKKKIIIAGGGCQGAQIADYLSSLRHQITIVELSEHIALEMPGEEKALLIKRLADKKVKIHTSTKIIKLNPDGVIIAKGKGKTKLKSDHIVICFGRKSDQQLFNQIKTKYKNIFNIGDSNKVARIGEAIRHAAEICSQIK